jgi:hypothetical protein
MRHPPRNIEWYREAATHYEHQAARATDPAAKQMFQEVATHWRKLAEGYLPPESGGQLLPLALNESGAKKWWSISQLRSEKWADQAAADATTSSTNIGVFRVFLSRAR